MAAGVNSGGGARIVHRDEGGPGQRFGTKGRPTPAPGDQDIASREFAPIADRTYVDDPDSVTQTRI